MVNHRNVHGYIRSTATILRQKIAEELKDKFICLMVDLGTANKKSIFGINAQRVLSDKIAVRNLSMEKVTNQHTSENLCDSICQMLSVYGITPDQVYAFTSDNAYNMVKAGRLLNEEGEEDPEDPDAPLLLTEDQYEDAILNMLTDCEYYADLVSNVAEKYAQRNPDIHVRSTNNISCANHSMHLGVEKGITLTIGARRLIEESRTMIKLLRTPTILNRIEKTSFKMPQIDVPTRWNSKYVMVIIYQFHFRHFKQLNRSFLF